MNAARLRPGMKWVVAFFSFGTAMSALAMFLLAWPGTSLDSLWRINPAARMTFQSLGPVALVMMIAVGLACAAAAIGLACQKAWARWLAILILTVNLVGDALNAWLRHDPRTLIGLPIAGALLFYLMVWGKAEPGARASGEVQD